MANHHCYHCEEHPRYVQLNDSSADSTAKEQQSVPNLLLTSRLCKEQLVCLGRLVIRPLCNTGLCTACMSCMAGSAALADGKQS